MNDVDGPVYQYMTGQAQPSYAELLPGFEARSAAVREAGLANGTAFVDIAYASAPRCQFDLFIAHTPASAVPSGAVLYLHAGYWQSRDKSQFSFLAPAFNAMGQDVAIANYPLCPDVTVANISVVLRRAVVAVLSRLARMGRGQDRLTIIGHSAGAHLAVELALADWDRPLLAGDSTLQADTTLRGPACPVRAIVGLSGVYDLRPLLQTPLNDKLCLNAETARVASPVLRVHPVGVPALFAVGTKETQAFHAQTDIMAHAWRQAGMGADTLHVSGADHFSLLDDIAGQGALFTAIRQVVA
ncbi:alpha/beta hydrolase [Acetobacter sp. TBRC 12305]|uniref:Alpha/beta hydrolase n=1 Tax=Acetobacter garciniae TaxID=2817435 RepID=A0A939KMZ0_9PROT|nr:alpha/beta hydrolase [Acetobacter garciniae]MBO1325075.1 alpha/beta hydrolase [Acetobacter garciniae]MBX0344954.1 alpha/beta hydrolase [Acetobacter garciniae]